MAVGGQQSALPGLAGAMVACRERDKRAQRKQLRFEPKKAVAASRPNRATQSVLLAAASIAVSWRPQGDRLASLPDGRRPWQAQQRPRSRDDTDHGYPCTAGRLSRLTACRRRFHSISQTYLYTPAPTRPNVLNPVRHNCNAYVRLPTLTQGDVQSQDALAPHSPPNQAMP